MQKKIIMKQERTRMRGRMAEEREWEEKKRPKKERSS
jgi:hypothetical protein